jgi:hypothetical protein
LEWVRFRDVPCPLNKVHRVNLHGAVAAYGRSISRYNESISAARIGLDEDNIGSTL